MVVWHIPKHFYSSLKIPIVIKNSRLTYEASSKTPLALLTRVGLIEWFFMLQEKREGGGGQRVRNIKRKNLWLVQVLLLSSENEDEVKMFFFLTWHIRPRYTHTHTHMRDVGRLTVKTLHIKTSKLPIIHVHTHTQQTLPFSLSLNLFRV